MFHTKVVEQIKLHILW